MRFVWVKFEQRNSYKEPLLRKIMVLYFELRDLEKQKAKDLRTRQKALFEDYKGRVQLVQEVLDGNTTFVESIDSIAQNIQGVKSLAPALPEEQYEGQLNDLGTILGYSINESESLLGNPLAGTAMLSTVGIPAAILLGHDNFPHEKNITRRSLLFGVLGSAAVATVALGPLSMFRHYEVDHARQRAQYCDNLVREIYNG